MFVDTHAHLSYTEFAADLPAVIQRATAAGVTQIISIATNLEDARRVVAMTAEFPNVFAAVGLHPGSVPEAGLSDLPELRVLAANPRVVAVGETGLDYFREAQHRPDLRQQQQDLLWAQLDLARERRLPVIIHNRAAETDIIEILRVHASKLPGDVRPWGVMHCFSGDLKFARACLEIGLLISYTGILTFKNARTLHEVASVIPLDQVMLETDAPYLAPVPHRGKRNEPSYVPLIAAALAELKQVSIDEVARVTSATAARLFGIPTPSSGAAAGPQ